MASVVIGDHEHHTIQLRPTHCTIEFVDVGDFCKCGNSGAQFMRWGICVRAVPIFLSKHKNANFFTTE